MPSYNPKGWSCGIVGGGELGCLERHIGKTFSDLMRANFHPQKIFRQPHVLNILRGLQEPVSNLSFCVAGAPTFRMGGVCRNPSPAVKETH